VFRLCSGWDDLVICHEMSEAVGMRNEELTFCLSLLWQPLRSTEGPAKQPKNNG
jgi:hypothetical protein